MPHEWQSEFPIAEAKVIAQAVLSRSFDASLLRQAWIVLEYGVGQLIPEGVFSAVGPTGYEHVSIDDAFGTLLAACDAPQGIVAFGAIPWVTIVKYLAEIVLPLIVEILE